MVHEFAFSDVVCPDRRVVLEVPLRDFSIGHRLILLKQRNPLLWQPVADFNSLPLADRSYWLMEAVYVCAQSFAYRQKLEKDPSRWLLWGNAWRVWRWHRRHRHYQAADWNRETVKFREYLDSTRLVTAFSEKQEGIPFLPVAPVENTPGRTLGGPYDAALIQFLVRQLGLTMAGALEFPLALAQVHFLTWLEREGNLKILNAEEMDFKDYCADYDLKAARAAGFATVAEHVAAVLAADRSNKTPKT